MNTSLPSRDHFIWTDFTIVVPAAITAIVRGSGFAPRWQQARDGSWSIGLGTKEFSMERVNRKNISEVSERQAFALLARHFLTNSEPNLETLLGEPTEFPLIASAVTSLAYQMGWRSFAHSNIARLIRASRFEEAADEVELWFRDGAEDVLALYHRRQVEALLLRGDEAGAVLAAERVSPYDCDQLRAGSRTALTAFRELSVP